MNYKCVKCNTEMIKDHVDEVEVDLCPTCKSLWLDKDEIRLLAQKSEQALDEIKRFMAEDPTDDSYELVERPCPSCQTKLTVAAFADVVIRHCPGCDGVFLERDELERAMNAVREQEGATVVALARSVVARGIINS